MLIPTGLLPLEVDYHVLASHGECCTVLLPALMSIKSKQAGVLLNGVILSGRSHAHCSSLVRCS